MFTLVYVLSSKTSGAITTGSITFADEAAAIAGAHKLSGNFGGFHMTWTLVPMTAPAQSKAA